MKKVGIQINPGDNVVTVVDDAAAGDSIQHVTSEGREELTVVNDVPFGHKVAVKDIGAGEPVVKYNEVIGRASAAIRRGEHVHAHNVQSAVQGGPK